MPTPPDRCERPRPNGPAEKGEQGRHPRRPMGWSGRHHADAARSFTCVCQGPEAAAADHAGNATCGTLRDGGAGGSPRSPRLRVVLLDRGQRSRATLAGLGVPESGQDTQTVVPGLLLVLSEWFAAAHLESYRARCPADLAALVGRVKGRHGCEVTGRPACARGTQLHRFRALPPPEMGRPRMSVFRRISLWSLTRPASGAAVLASPAPGHWSGPTDPGLREMACFASICPSVLASCVSEGRGRKPARRAIRESDHARAGGAPGGSLEPRCSTGSRSTRPTSRTFWQGTSVMSPCEPCARRGTRGVGWPWSTGS